MISYLDYKQRIELRMRNIGAMPTPDIRHKLARLSLGHRPVVVLGRFDSNRSALKIASACLIDDYLLGGGGGDQDFCPRGELTAKVPTS